MSETSTRRVGSSRDYRVLETLFREYAQTLGIDLGFQNFQAELMHLQEIYGSAGGAAFIASCRATDDLSTDDVGCVGIRRLTDDTCEMKRLYVRPQARGLGLGTLLASKAVDIASSLGYSRVVLDTLSTMKAAMHLYNTLGFVRTAPYYNNPLPDAVYFEKRIAP